MIFLLLTREEFKTLENFSFEIEGIFQAIRVLLIIVAFFKADRGNS